MEVWEKLTKPSLLLNTKIAKANLRRMAEKAQRLNLSFRPHFKTHQSAKVGDWFRAFNVEKIAVSSLEMAEYFAENGWQDILVAFPVNLREIATIHRLAEKIQLGLLVSTPNSATLLAHHMHTAVDVWLEIDAGYPRSGIPSSDLHAILEAIETINAAKRANDFVNARGPNSLPSAACMVKTGIKLTIVVETAVNIAVATSSAPL